jgi:hypothetical protein
MDVQVYGGTLGPSFFIMMVKRLARPAHGVAPEDSNERVGPSAVDSAADHLHQDARGAAAQPTQLLSSSPQNALVC